MIEEREVVTLLLGIGTLIFVLVNHRHMRVIPAWRLLITGFIILLVGWASAIVEGIFAQTVFNLIEHLCYAASSILLAGWTWQLANRTEQETS